MNFINRKEIGKIMRRECVLLIDEIVKQINSNQLKAAI